MGKRKSLDLENYWEKMVNYQKSTCGLYYKSFTIVKFGA